MKTRINHKRPVIVRKTISMPEDVFKLSKPRAVQFEDYSKYVQSLIQRDVAGDLKISEVAA